MVDFGGCGIVVCVGVVGGWCVDFFGWFVFLGCDCLYWFVGYCVDFFDCVVDDLVFFVGDGVGVYVGGVGGGIDVVFVGFWWKVFGGFVVGYGFVVFGFGVVGVVVVGFVLCV